MHTHCPVGTHPGWRPGPGQQAYFWLQHCIDFFCFGGFFWSLVIPTYQKCRKLLPPPLAVLWARILLFWLCYVGVFADDRGPALPGASPRWQELGAAGSGKDPSGLGTGIVWLGQVLTHFHSAPVMPCVPVLGMAPKNWPLESLKPWNKPTEKVVLELQSTLLPSPVWFWFVPSLIKNKCLFCSCSQISLLGSLRSAIWGWSCKRYLKKLYLLL